MIKKIQFITVFFAFTFIFNQNTQAAYNHDSITTSFEQVKMYLNSTQWEPVDFETYKKIFEVVHFIEKSPIDTVIEELRTVIDSNTVLFTRQIKNIEEAESIEGYTNAHEINNTLINIEKRAEIDMPLESIIVPEKEFVGMYSTLPLISPDEALRLLADSIITLPDSLKALAVETDSFRSSKNKKNADSLIALYLEDKRKHYNDSLITNYRDSVSNQYRTDYRNKYIDSLKKAYTNQVAQQNYVVLKRYNDSLSQIINQQFRDDLQRLIDHVHRMPNQLTIYNLAYDSSNVILQNDNAWYKWVYLKNMQNDSIGIKVESFDRNSLRLLVDESINLSRLTQRTTLDVSQIQSTQKAKQTLEKIVVRKPKLSPWKLGGNAYTGLSQTLINEFWSKGGKTSASLLSTINYSANYSKGKLKWDNGLDAKLGLIYYIEDNESAIRNWHKNSDNFEINSRFGYSAFKEWYYSAEANFKTQFFDGYKSNTVETPNSSWFSPAYLTFSAGFDYKPNSSLSTFLSPLSIKTTYVLDPDVDETIYGLTEGQTRKSRIGMTGRLDFTKKVFENINLRTKNNFFFNFGFKDGEWQLIKLPDFDSETSIDFKVNRYVTTQLNLHFIYDKELTSKWTDDNNVEQTGTRLQFKEFMTLGISYRF
ncbi:MAG: DUF3078 domain-containing protein [Prolixibacteraceae bacterium]|nr:DUF3078 domain-containing protein [Prolixibacteraceae bacterium]